MPKLSSVVLACAILLAACDRGDRGGGAESRALAGRVMKGALAYPQSTLIGLSAGADVAELRFTSPAGARKVADWFRTALPLNRWELEHDAVNRDGAIVITARQGKRPLWITVTPNVGGPGSTYSLIGAVVEGDSIR